MTPRGVAPLARSSMRDGVFGGVGGGHVDAPPPIGEDCPGQDILTAKDRGDGTGEEAPRVAASAEPAPTAAAPTAAAPTAATAAFSPAALVSTARAFASAAAALTSASAARTIAASVAFRASDASRVAAASAA